MPTTLFPLLIHLVLLAGSLQAQTVEQWTAWGDAAFAQAEYYGASRFYAGALALEPGRMSLQWKQAEACRLSNQYPQAIDLYKRVYQKDLGRTHPTAAIQQGEMELCDGRYADALATWTKVLRREKDTTSTVARRARNAIAGCHLASDTDPSPFVVTHLAEPVNTEASEFAARWGPDSSLWFTSLRGVLNAEGEVQDSATYRVGIHSSTATPHGWNEPMAETAQPDAVGHSNANLMWTPNGERMYFTWIDADGAKHLATRTPNGPAQVLTGLETHPDATQPWAFDFNGQAMLLFAASGGEGGLDIWIGDLNGNSIVGIRNAGNRVNTPGNECTPSFDGSTNTLWFSSDFHAGLGGYDIFRSALKNDGGGAVEHVRGLNSPANDLYPVFDAIQGKGWLTSNRKGSFAAKGETCCNDIYAIQASVTPPPMDSTDSIHVVMERDSTGVPTAALLRMQAEFPLKLYFHNDEPEPRTRQTGTAQPYGATYDAYAALFPTYRRASDDPAGIDAFFNQEVEKGRRDLTALETALAEALEAGERITLDVRGHASPLAKNDYNQRLSQRRIESLRNHLRMAQHGALAHYMDSTATNGGVLRLRVLPYGEERSLGGVSDDLHDLGRSVYSPAAARERRIEVERIHIEPSTIGSGPMMQHNIGTVRQGVPQDFQIPVKNTGQQVLRIIRGVSSCDCVRITDVPAPIPPGGTGTLHVHYSGRTRPGPLERLIQLEVDGASSPLQLTIHGNVTE